MGKRFGFILLNCLALLSVAVPNVGAQQGYDSGQPAGGQTAVGGAQMPAELPPFSAGGSYGGQPPAYGQPGYGGQPPYGQPGGGAPYNGGAQYSQYAPLGAPQSGQY